MVTINLPRLVSSRVAAFNLIEATGGDLKGERVVVNCRELRSATGSFVDELVKILLCEREASEVVVLGGSPEFLERIHRAARIRCVNDRITERPAGSEVQA